MGFLSKVFKPVQKIVQKVVPKEIRPALPFIAAAFGAPYLAQSSFLSGIGNQALRQAIAKGLVSATTSGAMGGDTKDILRSGILAAAPDVLSEGLGKFSETYGGAPQGLIEKGLATRTPLESIAYGAGKAAEYLTDPSLSGQAKIIGGLSSIEGAAQMAELNEKAIKDYEAQLAQQGVIDKSDRRNAIFGYFSRAGYEDDEINSMLNKYGYASGGRVGYKEAGLVTLKVEDLLEMMSNKGKDKEDKFDSRGLSSGIEGLMSGYKMGTGRSLLSEPEVPRFTPGQFYNQGGAITPPGMEMDLRGGGFIRIGSKEKADDVNARVSKNEFVMTADAVRGAGRGDPRLGAKRMYEIMNKFEAMA